MENQIQADHSFIYKEESFAIRGAIFEVYKTIGSGFLEPVYQECLEREFKSRQIPFQKQPDLFITYKGEVLPLTYKPDFICFEIIIVELKAVKEISDEHKAQIHNYLRASGMRLGLLVNFGHTPRVEIERIII